MNGLQNLDKTYSEYLVVPTDDKIRFWRSKTSKVKVRASRRVGKGIHADDGASKYNFYSRIYWF